MSDDKHELRERLAALEHQQWAHWTRHMLTRLGLFTHEGGLTIAALEHPAAADIARWQAQCCSSYALLSETEKESDRQWADKVLDAVSVRS
jgi:hypothetical protein